ncbi:MAG TPA: hypothetical protein VFW83_03120 [Bryobacteraceae bacterium]|nr:hypothetical protein [Bryobacteraceae bacterium]
MPQRTHRLDSRGAGGQNQRGRKRRDSQDQTCPGDEDWIARLQPVQQRIRGAPAQERQRNPARCTREHYPGAFAQYEEHDSAPLHAPRCESQFPGYAV